MRSRMEKYYNDDMSNNERVKKNQKLYDTIYSLNPLLDIDYVATANEMELLTPNSDVNIKSRENYRRLKQYKNIIQKEDIDMDSITINEEEKEDKIYDINSILEKAKMEREEQDSRGQYRKLRNTQYNILSGLNIGEKVNVTDEEAESDEEKLKSLINTITMNKRVLNDLDKKDQPNDLLYNLLPGEDTFVSGKVTESVAEEVAMKSNDDNVNLEDFDKSFYTSSLSFSKEDFEDEAKEFESTVKVNNILIKVLLFVLIIIVTTVSLFILNNHVDFNLFNK